jgi:predicted DNA-binding ribbon-helix-helix protein
MKGEVYSWRLSRDLKDDLEQAARKEGVSLSRLLERIARDWLQHRSAAADDQAEQERIRARAMRFVGSIQGGDPDRAAKARERVREVLARKYGR